MKRRQFLYLAGAGGAMALLQRSLAAGAVETGLRRVTGHVTINGQAARQGMPVRAGDTIVTAPGAEAVYVVDRDAFLQRAGSTVEFGATGTADFLRIVSGRLLSVFGRGNRRLTMATATIGIRGTGCYIEAAPERTYFCLCYGEAEVVPAVAPGQRETIRTRHHDHPIYIHADAAMATSMVPASVVNHSDAELVLLESLVGRKPPFDAATPGNTYSY